MRALLLAGGLGTRLGYLTKNWPKCLMPIHKHPLLEFWINILKNQNIKNAIVNTHYHSDIVIEFLNKPQYKEWITPVYESKLLGTAGTLRENIPFFKNEKILLVHADNWCCCDFTDFILYHNNFRPKNTLITMMTFDSSSPETCGIVELDENGIVVKFHEKIKNPPGTLANGAVYILEPEVLQWLENSHNAVDFSTDVLPNFIGKIATWKNNNIHKDIGNIETLIEAQYTNCDEHMLNLNRDSWQKNFENSAINNLVSNLSKKRNKINSPKS
jgi:mannose-1-phosphate guanylyltransferase